MSTIVYQGLQSSMESQLIETTTLKLKVAAPSSMELSRGPCMASCDTMEIKEKYYHQDINKKATIHVGEKIPSNLDLGGWSFLQNLSNIPSTPKEANEKQSSYVHPLTKRSPRLSQESLELCTENLGSETGSDTMESSILSFNSANSSPVEQHKLPRETEPRSKSNSRNFPPPLTTIRSSNTLQVRPHREDGRLIIKAIETPSRSTYLHAERSNGRLRLCFWKDSATNFDSEMTNEENEGDPEDETIDEYESDINDEEQDDENENDAYMSKDMEGNNLDAEVEIGMEKFQRLSRCKEGGHENKGLCNWKPLWVATS